VATDKERDELFQEILKFRGDVKKVSKAKLARAKKEGWITCRVFVKSTKVGWIPVGKKRKRPTYEEFLLSSKKRRDALTKKLEVLKSQEAELTLQVKTLDAARLIASLKEQLKEKA
jgi:hypothetical protein